MFTVAVFCKPHLLTVKADDLSFGPGKQARKTLRDLNQYFNVVVAFFQVTPLIYGRTTKMLEVEPVVVLKVLLLLEPQQEALW